MRDLSRYNRSREFFTNRPASFIAYSYVPAFACSVWKMHINTEVHFDASGATRGNLCTLRGQDGYDRYPVGSIIAAARPVASESRA